MPGDLPGDLQFLSTITVKNTSYNNIDIEGDIQSSKRKAELSAAEKALNQINILFPSEPEPNNYVLSNQNSLYILIDLENVRCWDSFQNIQFDKSITVVFFVGKLDPSSSLISKSNEKHKVIVIDSCIKDAVDIAIVGKAVELLLNGIEKVIVVSRDHFAGALYDCVEQGLFEVKGKLQHVTSFKSLLTHLNE